MATTKETRDTKDGNNKGTLTAGDYGPEEGMVQMQIRIPPQLKRSLEDEAERLTNTFGVPVSTSGVLRKLLAEGLQRSRSTK
jgi:hypothetical protein